MCELSQVMPGLDVHRQVHPEIIGDAVAVAFRERQSPSVLIVVLSYRKRYGTSCGVVYVDRQGVAVGELVVGSKLCLVRLVVRSVVPCSAVDGLHPAVVHLAQLRTGVGVGSPACQLTRGTLDHEFHSISPSESLHEFVSEMVVHQKRRPRLVVKIV